MKYYVVDRGDKSSLHLTETFHRLAKQYQMTLDEREPDVIISIGGDGTMLQAFHMFVHHLEKASFVGIHTGKLGFFADWMPEEIEDLMALMNAPAMAGKFRNVQYPLVEIELTTQSGKETHLALNEFAMKGLSGTLVAQLNINKEVFEMFRGDGICVSTPSGSTAYNKSLNGAVIHPSLEALQIAEIASINNRVFRTLGSSMILPKHHYCDIFLKEADKLLLSIDHVHTQRDDVISIHCQVAKQKINFARFRPFPFWSRVREAFIDLE